MNAGGAVSGMDGVAGAVPSVSGMGGAVGMSATWLKGKETPVSTEIRICPLAESAGILKFHRFLTLENDIQEKFDFF